MKVIALTLLSLVALSQARLDYKLQCNREEVGIRWPSYFSNSEYYVCQSVYGGQLTVHCPAGEVFTFVLQQCAAPALYVPAPPMDSLPTAAPITTHLIDEIPPVLGSMPAVHLPEEHQEHIVHALPSDPTPPTPPTEPPTPPTVVVDAPKPGKKPVAPVLPPVPSKASAPKKQSVPSPAKASAKKPSAPAPAKAAKKPTPPSKGQKKPSA
ncbi:extensin [Drosophila innubila]|uniref:extensin n=1 Tax=Drosophila innubila TaxID=198719 RepID=UPI00148CC86F|nr:extensin [Drosophila innubila]